MKVKDAIHQLIEALSVLNNLVHNTEVDLTLELNVNHCVKIVGFDRLVLDYNVSEDSPVVKGTWVTVSHIVDLIVDSWSWDDILQSHPELTEDDIRQALVYTLKMKDS